LKIAFNIAGAKAGTDNHLIIECWSGGATAIWYDSNPFQLNRIYAMQADPSEEIADAVEKWLSSADFPIGQAETVSVFFDLNESILIPEEYYREQVNQSLLALQHPTANHTPIVAQEYSRKSGIYCVYSLPSRLKAVIQDRFENVTFRHGSLAILEKQFHSQRMHCRIYPSCIKVWLELNAKLVLMQWYSYQCFEDVLYYLLNVCEQNGVDPAKIELVLGGWIEKDSAMFNQLYQYFLNLRFAATEIGNNPSGDPGIAAHFFEHFQALAKCE
jgi:Protein of unknown function (DUF3822)